MTTAMNHVADSEWLPCHIAATETPMTEQTSQKVSLELDSETANQLDTLGETWGIRDRGDVIKRLLKDLLEDIQLGK